jgi:ribonuclease J
MALNDKQHKDDLLFIPLGGSGEIGMNLNLYQLDGKWLMVDFGAGFAEDYMPGIDMIVPDTSFIRQRKKDLCGLVLTHAHEDHLGAIIYLWNEFLECPIYATPFTAALLKAKLRENKLTGQVKIIEVQPGSSFNVGPFDIEMVEITHSVPEMNGLFIKTRYGNIFHSGDWKLDPKPMLGATTDEDKLKHYGDEGVLAMISDSTNVFSPGTSGSEGDLRESLIDIIGKVSGLAIVTTFASNVARIETLAKAGHAAGRHVVLAGRSLWRMVNAAKETGYLKDMPDVFEDDIIGKYPRNEILVISTGCQGEPLAATAKIAHGAHRSIRVTPEDTVIFSSKIIPGNEKRLFRMFNKFIKLGVEIITERDHFVHVSGHPNRDELKRMYEMVRPEISVPVHGEDTQMHEHVHLAKEWGVKYPMQTANGVVIKLAPGKPERISQVDVGFFGIDGNYLVAPDSSIMRMRRRMQKDGLIATTLLMDDEHLIKRPLIIAPGVLDEKEDQQLIDAIKEEIEEVVDQYMTSRKKKTSQNQLENLTRSAIKRVVRSEVGKEPLIMVTIERL